MCQPHINRTTEILKQSARGNKKTKNNQLNFWNSLKTSTDQNKRNEQNSETAWKHKHTKNKRNEQILKQLENINIPKRNEQILKQLENVNRPKQRERNKYCWCFGLLMCLSCFENVVRFFCFGMLMFSSCFRISVVPFVLVCNFVRSFCLLFQNSSRSFFVCLSPLSLCFNISVVRFMGLAHLLKQISDVKKYRTRKSYLILTGPNWLTQKLAFPNWPQQQTCSPFKVKK